MFYYDLAESLGYASVSYMLSTMTSAEVSEWGAYLNLRDKKKSDGVIASETAVKAKAIGRMG